MTFSENGSTKRSLLWHIILENLGIENFSRGILVQSAFDIIVQNCQVSDCQVGLRLETIGGTLTPPSEVTSQIKVFGGFFVRNQYHLSVDGPDAEIGTGDIFLYGWTCGHQRTGVSNPAKAEGIGLYKPVTGLSVFGCHFEDLAHGIQIWSPTTSNFVGTLTVLGSMFGPIRHAAIEAGSNANLGALALTGNRFDPESGYATATLFNVPNVLQGAMISGNIQGHFDANFFPKTGFAEVSQQGQSEIEKSTYRVSSFNYNERPSASDVLKGTIIFYSHTNKINISDGSNWRHADGTYA